VASARRASRLLSLLIVSETCTPESRIEPSSEYRPVPAKLEEGRGRVDGLKSYNESTVR